MTNHFETDLEYMTRYRDDLVKKQTELREIIDNQGFLIEQQRGSNQILLERINFLRSDVRALENLLDEARTERDEARKQVGRLETLLMLRQNEDDVR